MTGQFADDFEFTWALLTDFFNQKQIQHALGAIAQCGATGWEKWWQIELAIYLSDHGDIGDWNMEERFYTDLRRSAEKDSIAVDLSFRRKRHAQESMIFLELKQDSDWQRCINNMLRDANKFFSAQSRSHEGSAVRSFFVVGMYPREGKRDVHDYIAQRLDELDPDWELLIDTKFIANTPYSFTIF